MTQSPKVSEHVCERKTSLQTTEPFSKLGQKDTETKMRVKLKKRLCNAAVLLEREKEGGREKAVKAKKCGRFGLEWAETALHCDITKAT